MGRHIVGNSKIKIKYIILFSMLISLSSLVNGLTFTAGDTQTVDICDAPFSVEVIGVNTQSAQPEATLKMNGATMSVREGWSTTISNVDIYVNRIFAYTAPVTSGAVDLSITGNCPQSADNAQNIEIGLLNIKNVEIKTIAHSNKLTMEIYPVVCNVGNSGTPMFYLEYIVNGENITGRNVYPKMTGDDCITEKQEFDVINGTNQIQITVYDFNLKTQLFTMSKDYPIEIVHQCETNSDCNDNDKSTVDLCSKFPRTCSNNKIIMCRMDDGFCPNNCDFARDNDCDECKTHLECDDKNDLTIDHCAGAPKKCMHTEKDCFSDDGICPSDCSFENDNDCNACEVDNECTDNDETTGDKCEGSPKRCKFIPLDECSNNENCNDNNPCTTDTCSGSPLKCVSKKQNGCVLGSDCVETGYRTETDYCSTEIVKQKENGLECNYGYECMTNYCDSICKKKGIFKRLSNWFGDWF